MSKKSIKINYIYYVILQFLNIAFPLITAPYIARTIGEEGIGIFSYTFNNVSYLIMIGSFGIGLYATRQVAYCIDSKDEIRKCFSSIYFSRFITFVPVLIVYVLIVIFDKQFRLIYIIEIISIIDALFDAGWYYNGQENFKVTALRGIFIKSTCLALIFLLVKDESDLGIYVFLTLIGQLVGDSLLFLMAFKKVGLVRPNLEMIKNTLKGSAVLFAPQIASSLYFYCDKIMIRFLSSGMAENGYYEQAQRIILLSITIVTAMPTVVMPRASTEFSRNNNDKVYEYIRKSFGFVVVLAIPMSLGLIGVSNNLVPWFLGDRFEPVRTVIKVMAPIIFFNSIYNVFCYQYYIATKKEKELTLIVLVGASVNILLNFALIPMYGAIGAGAASMLSETSIAMIMSIGLANKMNLMKLLPSFFKATISSTVMMLFVLAMSNTMTSSLLNTFMLVVLGGSAYLIMMTALRDDVFIWMIKRLLKRNQYDGR